MCTQKHLRKSALWGHLHHTWADLVAGMVQRQTCHHCWWRILLWHQHRTFCVTQAQSSADVQPGDKERHIFDIHLGYKTPQIITAQPNRWPGKTEQGKFFLDLYLFPTMAVIWYVKQTQWMTKSDQKKLQRCLFYHLICVPHLTDARGRTGFSAQTGSNKTQQICLEMFAQASLTTTA